MNSFILDWASSLETEEFIIFWARLESRKFWISIFNFSFNLLDVGKEVYLVELQGKDPSELGFENFTKLIQTVSPLTQYKLMEKKLSTIWQKETLKDLTIES